MTLGERLTASVDSAARQAGVVLTDEWAAFYRLMAIGIAEALGHAAAGVPHPMFPVESTDKDA